MKVQAHTEQRSGASERRVPARILKCEVFALAFENIICIGSVSRLCSGCSSHAS